jgi:hypothetical protein
MASTPNDPGTADPAAGSAVPPYEGRRESADVDGEEKLRRDGAAVGGATGPVENEEQQKAPTPEDTERGAVASPAQERPAAEGPEDEPGEASVGPAHRAGTGRGEAKSRDPHEQGEGG